MTEIEQLREANARMAKGCEAMGDEIAQLRAAVRAAIPVLAADRSRQGVYAYQLASAAIAKATGGEP